MKKRSTKPKSKPKAKAQACSSQLELTGIKARPVWLELQTPRQSDRELKKLQQDMAYCFS